MRNVTRTVAGAAAGLAAALAMGCGPPEPGVVEIGLGSATTGVFTPIEEGAEVGVILGANGLNMIVPSLRAVDIDPAEPDPSVEIVIDGVVVAADIEGGRANMEFDGEGYVLWDLRVPFQTELCCYNCSTATINARVVDRSGRLFEGSRTVTVSRGECPDPVVCCASADLCPVPSMANLCL